MASPQAHVAAQLKGIPGYVDEFAKTFPGAPDPITLPNVQKAIAVFEATLITPKAPFDRFLQGNASALSSAQKARLGLLEKGYSACHSEMSEAACTPRSGWSRNRVPNSCRPPTGAA
jgi:cytochrome c peroxidase